MKAKIIKEKIKNASDQTRIDLQETRNWMFNVGAIWTVFLILLTIGEFLQVTLYDKHVVVLTANVMKLYLGFLATYAAAISKYKWDDPNTPKKPGEAFVIAWWILGIIICTAHGITGQPLPGQFETLLLGVLGIFVGKKTTLRVASHIKDRLVKKEK